MSDELQFTCSECGKQFDPDPDSMVEVHWSAAVVPEEQAEEMVSVTPEELETKSDYELQEMGLTPEIRDKLLSGEEDVTSGGICICRECQDRMEAEQG